MSEKKEQDIYDFSQTLENNLTDEATSSTQPAPPTNKKSTKSSQGKTKSKIKNSRKAKVTKDENSPYSVNRELVEESTKIKKRMEMLEQRLQKMDEHRTNVSESVYYRVREDYESQLDEVRESFEVKCQSIEVELQKLYDEQQDQESQRQEHEEVLEEAKFRHTLGEYTDEKYKDVEGQENKAIKKYSGVLSTIKRSIQKYEDILGHPFSPQEKYEEEEEAEKVREPETTGEFKLEADESSKKKPETPTEQTPPLGTAVETNKPTSQNVTLESEDEPEINAEAEAELLINKSGDYFQSEPEPSAPSSPETPPESSTKETTPTTPSPSEPPTVSTTEPDDDSISSILRNIPLEEPIENEKPVTPVEEPTGGLKELDQLGAEATLLLVEGNLDQHEFTLGDTTTIGRSPSNDIPLKEARVSRQHAVISLKEGNYVIVDLKSSNGILINNNRVEEIVLQDGDEVQIGSFKFQFNLI